MLEIRKFLPEDRDQIKEILLAIVKKGDAFVYSPSSSREELLDYSLAKTKRSYSAIQDGSVVGTFFMQDNQPGLGSHIANAGYATLPGNYGKGVGRAMGLFSSDVARKPGYKAMQFNIVVKTTNALCGCGRRWDLKSLAKSRR